MEDSNATRTCRLSVARACRKQRAWDGVCGVCLSVMKEDWEAAGLRVNDVTLEDARGGACVGGWDVQDELSENMAGADVEVDATDVDDDVVLDSVWVKEDVRMKEDRAGENSLPTSNLLLLLLMLVSEDCASRGDVSNLVIETLKVFGHTSRGR